MLADGDEGSSLVCSFWAVLIGAVLRRSWGSSWAGAAQREDGAMFCIVEIFFAEWNEAMVFCSLLIADSDKRRATPP
jgi:hypothetical protein